MENKPEKNEIEPAPDICCGNCRHYWRNMCRRYPPTHIVVIDDGHWCRTTEFPEVNHLDECGEFEHIHHGKPIRIRE